MLSPAETDELRVLQKRAYGRGGGLTAVDAARLAALEGRRAASAVATSRHDVASAEKAPTDASSSAVPAVPARGDNGGQGAASGQAHDDDVPGWLTELTSGSHLGVDRRAEPEPSPSRPSDPARHDEPQSGPADTLRGALRRHAKAAAAASVLLVVVGIAVGWLAFGRPADGISLTAEEQQRRAELEGGGEFDGGSLRAIGRTDDALLWYATKDGGGSGCVVLDAGGGSSSMCAPMEAILEGTGVTATAASSTEVDGAVQVSGTAVRSADGDIVAVIQTYDMSGTDWDAQFTGAEAERSRELRDEGFEPFSYFVVGYFRDEPVWNASRVEAGVSERCLIVDAVAARACRPGTDDESTLTAQGEDVDADGEKHPWRVELAYTDSGGFYLKVEGETHDAG